MKKKQKRVLLRIILSAVLLLTLAILEKFLLKDAPRLLLFFLYCVPYLIIGYDVLLRAGKNIVNGNLFDENFLMSIATIGAFAVSFLGDKVEFEEAVFVMLFYQVGELFQSIAVGRSRNAISDLMNIRPDYANLERDGEVTRVAPEEVAVGDVIVIRPGEKIPLDGTVIEGTSDVNTAALTGESLPRAVGAGDAVYSGCVNGAGLLRMKADKPYEDSTVARILSLVENAASRKSKSENFITVFARYYTPTVVFLSVLLAFLPPLISGNFAANFITWLTRALMFLVVSCPCALVISVPLSFFGGIGAASRRGILVKGSMYLEGLSSVKTVVFDKTGTLTVGNFSVTEVAPVGMTETELLYYAAAAESYSTHPIALALRKAAKTDGAVVSDVTEIPAHGLSATVDGKKILAGNRALMDKEGIAFTPYSGDGSVVYIACDGVYCGYVAVADVVKPDADSAIGDLKMRGIRTVMLTGDREKAGRAVAEQLELDEYHTELLAADKVEKVEEMLSSMPHGKKLMFVGDGVNDAPVLSRADIGVAMGGLGSDAAIEAADIVLMDDNPEKIAEAIEISKSTLQIVRENIIFALGVKVAVLILSAIGLTDLRLAVFADVGVAVLAIINAMRALRFNK